MSEDRPLLVGSLATQPKGVTIWGVIRRYLNQHGLPMDYALFSTYDAMGRALLAGAIDIAWNGPMAHAQALVRGNGACRTLAMRDTDKDVATIIVARSDSGIGELGDLRGRRLALGVPASTELRIIPVHELRQAGFDLETECEIVELTPREYPGGERWVDDRMILDAIAEGAVDAGALFEPAFDRLLGARSLQADDFTVVWRSEPFCHCAFTARPELSDDLGRRFVELMTAMDPADPEIKEMMELEHLGAWLPADDRGWDALASALKQQGLVGATF